MELYDHLAQDLAIYSMRTVCKLWKDYADFRIKRIKDLQYVLPNHQFTSFEVQLIIDNRHYFPSHTKYLIQLFKCINLASRTNSNIFKCLDLEAIDGSKTSCHRLRCTKHCSKFSITHISSILELLHREIKYREIREYACNLITHLDDEELILIIPYLIDNFCGTIGLMFLERCRGDNIRVINIIYWNLHTGYLKTRGTIFVEYLNQILIVINRENNDIMRKAIAFDTHIRMSKDVIVGLSNLDLKYHRIPIIPDTCIKMFNFNKMKIEKSFTKPVTIPAVNYDNKTINILYKKENILSDTIVINLINILSNILRNEEGVDLDVVKYELLSTDLESGYIIKVENCYTIHHIIHELNFTILNFIMENNSEKKAADIRQKFMESCAFYCVITYIFGIGDRHLENIMITGDGRLFHIDYSYILGNDPHPMFGTSKMKITDNMKDALGGFESEYYKKFNVLCHTIYRCFRRHINIILLMFNVLVSVQLTQERIYNEIIERLLIDESNTKASIALCEVIKSSSEKSNILDNLHYYSGGFKSFFG